MCVRVRARVCVQESDSWQYINPVLIAIIVWPFPQVNRWQAKASSIAFPSQSLANGGGLLDSPRSSPPPGMEAYGQIIPVATVVKTLTLPQNVPPVSPVNRGSFFEDDGGQQLPLQPSPPLCQSGYQGAGAGAEQAGYASDSSDEPMLLGKEIFRDPPPSVYEAITRTDTSKSQKVIESPRSSPIPGTLPSGKGTLAAYDQWSSVDKVAKKLAQTHSANSAANVEQSGLEAYGQITPVATVVKQLSHQRTPPVSPMDRGSFFGADDGPQQPLRPSLPLGQPGSQGALAYSASILAGTRAEQAGYASDSSDEPMLLGKEIFRDPPPSIYEAITRTDTSKSQKVIESPRSSPTPGMNGHTHIPPATSVVQPVAIQLSMNSTASTASTLFAMGGWCDWVVLGHNAVPLHT